MNTNDIISSGLLELHAAGLTSSTEASQVEQWLNEFPEVAAEYAAITAGLEAYAQSTGVQPSPSVKERIFQKINEDQSGRVVAMKESPVTIKTGGVPSFWRTAAAAAILLLLGSIALNIVNYNKYTQANKDLESSEQSLASLEEKNKLMEADMSVVQSKYSVPVALKGLEAAPDAAAKIFWMKNTGEVFIDPSNLPETPQGKQYQLWAIVDGKPVDAGMILTSKQGDKFRIQKMKSFGKAEAFAVTLETEKGNPTPEGPMFVMGKM
ncbi:MAG: anti-sigma factor [Bacteroidota bacterium]